MAAQRQRKRLMAEMNVVPYIDVMLVLLVIFMITAPLLTQGVKVDLPQASANPVEQKQQEPLIVTVDGQGRYYLGNDSNRSLDEQSLVNRVSAVLRRAPETQVLVRGDKNVRYGKVVYVMSLLQQAGAPGVGLLTEPPATVTRH